MNLKELSDYDPTVRWLMSRMLLQDKEYLKDIKKGLPFFTEEELSKIEGEKEHRSGLTFEQISRALSGKGMILKLPTFKKYINLKLIPGSIGRQSIGKSSLGLYPPSVIREINFIKYTLYSNLDFKTVLDRFQTTALGIVESSFPDSMSVPDFYPESGNINEFGECADKAIKRYAQELFEKRIIKKRKMEEIVGLVDTISDLLQKTEDTFSDLMVLLKEIPINGKVGFEMLLRPPGKKQS